jgi:hypothetical protein
MCEFFPLPDTGYRNGFRLKLFWSGSMSYGCGHAGQHWERMYIRPQVLDIIRYDDFAV